MLRWVRRACVLGLLSALALSGAFAAASPYRVTITADGSPLGAAAGTVNCTAAPDGRIAWTLENGSFQPAPSLGGKVVWDDAVLEGSGQAARADAITLKTFNVRLEESTGVDVSYRFRLVLQMDGDAVKALVIEQVK